MRLGEYDLSHEIDCSDEDDPDSCAPPYQDIAVDKFIFNTEYNDKVISPFDIGIVKLVTSFQANSKYNHIVQLKACIKYLTLIVFCLENSIKVRYLIHAFS